MPNPTKLLQGVYRGFAGAADVADASKPLFTANQRQMAEYYAKRRATELGEDPHVEMLLIDPFVGQQYRLHPPSVKGSEQTEYASKVRKVKPDEVQGRTKLYADGGHVSKVKDVLKQGARGWAAGLAGLPGDIEGLARMAIKYGATPGSYVDRNMSETPALPTSEFYNEWLPGGDWETPEGGVAQAIGTALGGVGATKLVRPAVKAVDLAAKYGVPLAEKAVANAMVPSQLSRQAGVIKAPGGNWLSGSVEDSLKGLKRPALGNTSLAGPVQPTADSAMNSWIDKQLTKYVKNDMATERDPVRALAERGVTHRPGVTEGMGVGWEPTELAGMRSQMGFPKEGVAKSNIAKDWEMASDYALQPARAGEYLSPGLKNKSLLAKVEQNPWLAKVPPETPVYGIDRTAVGPELDFNHLIDELRNATNPNSGLPADLLLKYDALDRVSVPQAVERVAKINAWREAQKVEANAAKANNAATVLHKEYPEQGMKWVELKKGKLPDDWSEEFVDTDLGKLRKFRDPKTGGLTATDPTEEALRDALKYEGDTMGHCVGGYCDDVASGASRIFSLRDKKGQPHVTIETRPGRLSGKNSLDDWAARYEETHGQGSSAAYLADHPEIEQAFVPEVVQIKGKGNKKPNDEYLPFVQDFVKSGKWSDVGDLQNTGLLQASKGRFQSPQNAGEGWMPRFDDLGIDEGFYTNDELVGHINAARKKAGYAQGGLVTQNTDYDPSKVDALVAQLQAEFA